MTTVCIDLEALFGGIHRLELDVEGLRREQPQFRREERPWYVYLEGRVANVFPWSEDRMGVSADVGTTFYRRLKRLVAKDNSLLIVQDGDDGMNVTFTVEDGPTVFELADIKRALYRPDGS